MDYRKICKKIIGKKQYEELITKIATSINEKSRKNTTIEEMVQIVEINIRAVLIIGISKGIKLSEEQIKEKLILEKSGKYLTKSDYKQFEEQYKKEIDIIEKYIKQ